MGEIINIIEDKIQKHIQIRYIQKITIEYLDELFNSKLSNIKIEYESGIGERGVYENEENQMILIAFDYLNVYQMQFNLYYDQLEFYICKGEKVVAKCNLEDYTRDENKMIATFVNYLTIAPASASVTLVPQIKKY